MPSRAKEVTIIHIELRTAPGCPHAERARAILADCLTTVGIDSPIVEVVGRYPSPTVLIDGVDVMAPNAAPLAVEACRLDQPDAASVLTALRRALPERPRPRIAQAAAGSRATSLTEAHRIAHEAGHTLTVSVPKLSSAVIHAYPATTDTHCATSDLGLRDFWRPAMRDSAWLLPCGCTSVTLRERFGVASETSQARVEVQRLRCSGAGAKW